MQPTKTCPSMLARLAGVMSKLRRQDDFTCGDCERWERCGLPSSDDCVFRAAQLAQGGWKLRRQARVLSRIIGPM
jgi:hypothetical protein